MTAQGVCAKQRTGTKGHKGPAWLERRREALSFSATTGNESAGQEAGAGR